MKTILSVNILIVFSVLSFSLRISNNRRNLVHKVQLKQITKLQYSNTDSKLETNTQSNLKLGVLLLNLGGPTKKEDVEGFLYNLFVDPDIIRLPPFISFLQKPIAYWIAKRRAPQSIAAYESIGGGSPIVMYTQAQADLIQQGLRDKGLDATCYFAMRYWNPYTEECLDKMTKDGINSIVILPLYPQYSISTSGSSLKLLQEIFYQKPKIWGTDKVQHTVVPSWYYRQGYIRTMASLVLDEIKKFTEDDFKTGLHILFSAHGVPESYILAGDPYKRQIEECVRLIAKETTRLIEQGTVPVSHQDKTSIIDKIKFHLSFQSRVGPVQWLRPYTEDVLEELGKEGVKNLIVVPVSFVSEHVETLEEIDQEYREVAHEAGIEKWRRVPAVNTDKRFISDMTDLVIEALESPVLSLAESTQNLDILEDTSGSTGLPKSLEGGKGTGEFGLQKMDAENLSGRFAMIGILGTTIAEAIAGHPILQIAGMK